MDHHSGIRQTQVQFQLMHQLKLGKTTPGHRCYLAIWGELWIQEDSQAANLLFQSKL